METKNLKIAIIGAGNMGGAIARGLSRGRLVDANKISVSDISEKNLTELKNFARDISISRSNAEVIQDADIVILAVKPWLIKTVADEIDRKLDYKRQIIVSIAAGVSFEQLTEYFDTDAMLFRVIPNTAIDVLQSATTISSCNATAAHENLIVSLLAELGRVFLVPENQLSAFTSLASCGIAYAFRYIRAAMEGGVEMGIYPNAAKEVVLQTLRGAIELLEANESHPEVEIDKVTTPGGITIKGLNEMEANGFSTAVIKGLKASHLK